MSKDVATDVGRALLAGSLLLASPAVLAGGALYVRGGGVMLADTGQNLDGYFHDFDSWSDSAYAVGFETRKQNGLSFGVEYLSFRNSFTTPTASRGHASASVVCFVFRKYFNFDGRFRLYLGLGAGGGEREYAYRIGPTSNKDYATGLALQAVAGFELNLGSNVTAAFEIKGVNFNSSGFGTNDYNPSGTGVLLGFGWAW